MKLYGTLQLPVSSIKKKRVRMEGGVRRERERERERERGRQAGRQAGRQRVWL